MESLQISQISEDSEPKISHPFSIIFEPMFDKIKSYKSSKEFGVPDHLGASLTHPQAKLASGHSEIKCPTVSTLHRTYNQDLPATLWL
jgi:hypothetical protein